jgi:tRNA threonylcarbamoyladenosine biosynthesis protein TsaB
VIILTLRTDKPEAEIGLYDDTAQLAYETWQAHRELAETLHQKIDKLLKNQHKSWHDIEGVAVYQGPGSFTGLRIGLSVANALADSLNVPIVTAQTDDWVANGLQRLQNGEDDSVALPEYGAPVHITQQKH